MQVSGCVLECEQGSGLCIHNSDNCEVDDSNIGPCAKHGITTNEDGFYSLVCKNVHVFKCRLFGVAINNPTEAILTSVEVSDCCTDASAKLVSGVLVRGSRNTVKFENIDIHGCRNGVIILKDAVVKASKCSVSDCRSYGFHIDSEDGKSPNVSLRGCKITTIGRFEVQLMQGSVKIVSCSFKACRTAISATGEKSKIEIEQSEAESCSKDVCRLQGAGGRGMLNTGNQSLDPASPGTPGPSMDQKYFSDEIAIPKIKYCVGDVLVVLSDRGKAEMACKPPYLTVGWVIGMRNYLGKKGVVLAALEKSVKLKHEDGEEWLWGHGAVKLDKRFEKLQCKPRDIMQIVKDEATAKRAFVDSDAHFTPYMRQYLGKVGTVLEVDTLSVKLQHGDGRSCWWGYGALQQVDKTQIKLEQQFKKGDKFRLINLVNKVQYNGQIVEVQECDEEERKVIVSTVGEIRPGVTIQVHSLPHPCNGARGIVSNPKANGSWEVRLISGSHRGNTLPLKPENMTVQDDSNVLKVKPENLQAITSESSFHSWCRQREPSSPKRFVRVELVQESRCSRKSQTIKFPYNKFIVKFISEHSGGSPDSFEVRYNGSRITTEMCADYGIEDGDELELQFNVASCDKRLTESQQRAVLLSMLFNRGASGRSIRFGSDFGF